MQMFDGVVLLENLPDEGLSAGMVGTIVEIHGDPIEAYEVEFCNTAGETLAQLALQADQIRMHSADLDGTGVAINEELFSPED